MNKDDQFQDPKINVTIDNIEILAQFWRFTLTTIVGEQIYTISDPYAGGPDRLVQQYEKLMDSILNGQRI